MSTPAIDTNLDFDILKVEKLFAIVTKVLSLEHAATDQKSGAVIHLCTEDGDELLYKREGTATEQKFVSFEYNATEKTGTLLEHPEHSLSFESCDMANGPYPGGVRFPPLFIMAISGFKWEEDEIGVHWIAYKMGWIELKDIPPLVKMSQENVKLFSKLFCLFDRAEEAALAA